MDSLKLYVFSVKSSDAWLQTNDGALSNLMRNAIQAEFLCFLFQSHLLVFAIEIQLIEGVFHCHTWRGQISILFCLLRSWSRRVCFDVRSRLSVGGRLPENELMAPLLGPNADAFMCCKTLNLLIDHLLLACSFCRALIKFIVWRRRKLF